MFFQPLAEFGYLLRGVAHEDDALLVSLELRCDTVHGAQGCHGDEFALGRRELVGSVDVAEEASWKAAFATDSCRLQPMGSVIWTKLAQKCARS